VVSGIAYCALFLGMPPFVKVALMGLASALAIQTFTFGPMLVAEVAPIGQRGALLAITNSITTTAGLIGPFAMGKLLGAAGDAHCEQQRAGDREADLVAAAVAGFLLLDPQRSRRKLDALQ
jgi:ACS family D-galactonate transporter-like MFS transporter